jgi:hypothetical protein
MRHDLVLMVHHHVCGSKMNRFIYLQNLELHTYSNSVVYRVYSLQVYNVSTVYKSININVYNYNYNYITYPLVI